MLSLHIIISDLQEIIIIHILQFHPSALGLNVPKNAILMITRGPVECAVLSGTLNPSGSYLVDIDVSETVFVDVLLYGEGDGCEGYGFAEEPAYALLARRQHPIETMAVRRGLPFRGDDHSRLRDSCSVQS